MSSNKNSYHFSQRYTEQLLKQINTDVYMVDNHLYFRTEVSRDSIDRMNKELIAYNRNYDILKEMHKGYNVQPKPIYLHITSDGGDLFAGISTVDTIRNLKSRVYTYVEGAAASAATIISIAGKKRFIGKNAFMLIHQLSGGMWGKFESMKDDMQNCNLFMDRINEIYGQYTKIPKNILKDILKRDIYMDAKTCLKYGLVDKIIE